MFHVKQSVERPGEPASETGIAEVIGRNPAGMLDPTPGSGEYWPAPVGRPPSVRESG